MYTPAKLSGRTRSGLVLFTLSFFLFCIIIGGSVYQLIVEIPNWSGGSRAGLESFRGFFRLRHPGYFFQSMVPLTILSLAAATPLLRGRPEGAGKKLLLVLAGVLAAEAFTFGYFMPRNFVLFLNPLGDVTDAALMKAASEWEVANWIRTAMLLAVAGAYLRTALFLGRTYLAAPLPSVSAPKAARAVAEAI